MSPPRLRQCAPRGTIDKYCRLQSTMMVDTHTHLTDDPLAAALEDVLARARGCGVTTFIVPGYDLAAVGRARALAAQHDGVYAAAGIHPLFVRNNAPAALAAELAHGGFVALGEIGLDYVDAAADRALQQRVLTQQLMLARAHDMPVILHCRQAHDDLLNILRAHAGVRGVLHSCSCSHEQVKPFLALGLYVSFSGVVTRANARKARKLAERVPLDRIVAETDSPFIGNIRHPAPTSEPADVSAVIAALAELRGMTCADMANLTSANARRLFGL